MMSGILYFGGRVEIRAQDEGAAMGLSDFFCAAAHM
jgi:hypothetical protein